MMEKFRQETERVYGAVPKTHNCAQAVVEIFGRHDLVVPMAVCGAGRAPNGYCGALYGAMMVTQGTAHEALQRDFADEAGSIFCKEIKGKGLTPCKECVAIGAMLADRYNA